MNTEIIAQEGKWLTQANLEHEQERVFFKRCYPADGLTASDFAQWTDEQKAAWEREHSVENPEEVEPNAN